MPCPRLTSYSSGLSYAASHGSRCTHRCVASLHSSAHTAVGAHGPGQGNAGQSRERCRHGGDACAWAWTAREMRRHGRCTLPQPTQTNQPHPSLTMVLQINRQPRLQPRCPAGREERPGWLLAHGTLHGPASPSLPCIPLTLSQPSNAPEAQQEGVCPLPAPSPPRLAELHWVVESRKAGEGGAAVAAVALCARRAVHRLLRAGQRCVERPGGAAAGVAGRGGDPGEEVSLEPGQKLSCQRCGSEREGGGRKAGQPAVGASRALCSISRTRAPSSGASGGCSPIATLTATASSAAARSSSSGMQERATACAISSS